MGFPVSEAYSLPMNAKSLVEAYIQSVMVDKAFSVPKCVRLARSSHHSHRLLSKFF